MNRKNQNRLGVLALQGGFSKHLQMLESLKCDAVPVKEPADLEQIDGLIIPGGESTTIGMLMERFGMLESLKARIAQGFPVMGTCAGIILLADNIENSQQTHLGGLPITVRRNAYGRQIDSFEADIYSEYWEGSHNQPSPLRGVFIRAPQIIECANTVKVIAQYQQQPVVVQHGRLLGITFLPELTKDTRLHEFFIREIVNYQE